MATLKRGSTGSEVRELQTLLNNNGAKLSVDGKFGPKTQAAVQNYQKSNGLTVDGIVGDNTWGALRGTTSSQTTTTPAATQTPSTATGATQETGPTATTQTSSTSSSTSISGVPADTMAQLQNMEYTPSQNVLDAYNKLQEQAGTKPSPYVSQWSDQLEELYNQIVSRGKEGFDYDLNGDSLWQQYKDQYVNLGRRAMEDTMGNAASLTGGYGNSYASTAGNQAYQQYLTQLTNMIPELEGRAYERWRDQGEDLYNQYGLVADRENQDYGRWNDDFNRWMNERNYLTDMYNDERNFDYGSSSDSYNRLMALANMQNQDYWQNISNQFAEREMKLKEDQFAWQQGQAEKAASSSSSGGKSSSSKKRRTDNPTPTEDKEKPLTQDIKNRALAAYNGSYDLGEASDYIFKIAYETGVNGADLLAWCKKNGNNRYIQSTDDYRYDK